VGLGWAKYLKDLERDGNVYKFFFNLENHFNLKWTMKVFAEKRALERVEVFWAAVQKIMNRKR
jgi:hypothetical protein